ncbi:MAG: type II secretion system protein [Planctomycetia bacterium]|nr:type II secretion system protein [Planctomycetia bacterium]
MKPSFCSPIADRRLHGYTLVELVVALPIMALLMVAMGAAIKIASQAAPGGTSTVSTTLAAREVLDVIAADLTYATAITTDVTTAGAARQLTFNIPDRDGQSPTTETVTYSWSGTAGAPLTRTFNGTTTTIAASVQEFSLAYDKRSKALPTTYSTGAETLLISSDGFTLFPADNAVTSTNWVGQYFQPILASNVHSWNVTRAQLYLKKDLADTGQNLVQIRTASGGLPTTTVLTQTTLLENTLAGSYQLQSISFSGVPSISPTAGLCLVVQWQANGTSSIVKSWGTSAANSYCVSTTNGGSSWQAPSNSGLMYYIYGTVQTPDPTAYQYLLTGVRCTLRTGSDPTSRLNTTIRVLNEPQVTGP